MVTQRDPYGQRCPFPEPTFTLPEPSVSQSPRLMTPLLQVPQRGPYGDARFQSLLLNIL
jgi:hypothetical protein